MANSFIDKPKPKNYVTGKKQRKPIQANAISTLGVIALGAVLVGTGIAVAGVIMVLPALTLVGMVAGVAGAALKYQDTVNERERLKK
jgi:hypothetical protein